MVSAVKRGKGQPLVALLALLGGWVGGRAVNWEPPVVVAQADAAPIAGEMASTQAGYMIDQRAGPQSLPQQWSGDDLRNIAIPRPIDRSANYGPLPRMASRRTGSPLVIWTADGAAWGASARSLMPRSGIVADRADADFQLASRLQAPETITGGGIDDAPERGAGSALPPRFKRWSMDTWALVRRDGGGIASPGVLPATYGASQSGAVIRYRLNPADRHRSSAFLRTVSALGGVRENTMALGLQGRPIPSWPVVVAAEARLMDQAGRYRFQPAAFAYTELAPIDLPGNLRAETYVQGGFVGGRFATPFADGQIRVDRGLLRFSSIEARVGAGLWAGAQKGAARLDTGPSAAISMPLGKRMFGRVSVDWRFRVAGDAVPGSGPAITLSAGF